MSQEHRRSSRPSSVIKREELEEKLSKRKAESEIKVLNARSKALETVRRQEIDLFEEEATRYSLHLKKLNTLVLSMNSNVNTSSHTGVE